MGGWGPRGGGGLMGLGGAGGGMPHGGPHRGGGGGFGGPHPGMGRRDPRAIINYHDLDAPDDGDIF
ncbi:unnamed protein product [Cyprideis torosa]|nr:unnamed protein product [Cyprideis torosa]CAG0912061.1 unnamed protein product [Cyprideis torosa]